MISSYIITPKNQYVLFTRDFILSRGYTCHISKEYFGLKFMVDSHQIGGKTVQNYNYVMNDGKELSKTNLTYMPPNFYVRQCDVITDKAKTVEEYLPVSRDSHYEGHVINENPDMMRYLGSHVKSRKIYSSLNAAQEFERTDYEYDLPTQAVLKESHYHNGSLEHSLDYKYNKWGNLTYAYDSRTQLKKDITYQKNCYDYKNHQAGITELEYVWIGQTYALVIHQCSIPGHCLRITNLPVSITEQTYNPLTGARPVVTKTYTYNNTLRLGKPDTITVTDGTKTTVSSFTYDTHGNLKTKTVPINDQMSQTVEYEYDSQHNAYVVKEAARVTQWDGTKQDIIKQIGRAHV